MNPLEARLRYKFRNPLLLAEALTHASLGHETQRHHFDNQRLEFLGDAVLQLIVTEYLYDRYPDAPEGVLTKVRASLVSRSGLCHLARQISLGQFLMMGRGEDSSGGRSRPSVLADAFEAVIGAIYLDSDFVTARRVLLHTARVQLEAIDIRSDSANPKGELQEILQAISPVSPVYPILSQAGPEHERVFVARVVWCGQTLGEGEGRSKKDAEIAAARDALRKKEWRDFKAASSPLPPTDSAPTADGL